MEAEEGNPVGWFEIPVTDIARAEQFYSEFLGFEFKRQEDKDGMQMSWFPMDADCMKKYGATGMLISGPMYTPSHQGSLLYFSVASIAAALEKATTMGRPTLLPTTSIGEHGHTAWIEDTEGNRIALHSMNA